MFSCFLCSAYKLEAACSTPDLQEGNTNNLHNFIHVEKEIVRVCITRLEPKLTSGQNDIPARLGKGYSDLVKPLLRVLWNNSLKSGVFPDAWKIAVVISVHKKGARAPFKTGHTSLTLLEIVWNSRSFVHVVFAQSSYYPKSTRLYVWKVSDSVPCFLHIYYLWQFLRAGK